MRDLQATRGTPLSSSLRSAAVEQRGRIALLGAVAGAVIVLDQVSKAVVVASLTDHSPVTVVPHVVRLNLIRNAGAAFGMAQGATIVFSLVAAAVVVAILRTARTLRSAPWAVALGLLLGGAVGNLVDRVVRSPGILRGHVVDFIEFPHFPVFNSADSAITVGAVLMVLLSLRDSSTDDAVAAADDMAPAGD